MIYMYVSYIPLYWCPILEKYTATFFTPSRTYKQHVPSKYFVQHTQHLNSSPQKPKILCFNVLYVHKPVHRKTMLIIVQLDVTIYSLLIAAHCSTCFGWWHHPSSGAHVNVFTASGTGRSVWGATSRYRGWIETAVSVHLATETLRPVPDVVNKVICVPDDGWCHQPKYVEQCAAINKLYIVKFRWKIINIDKPKILLKLRSVIFWGIM